MMSDEQPTPKMRMIRFCLRIGLAASIGLCCAGGAGDGQPADEILQRLDQLRGIHLGADQKENDEANKRMDAIWGFLRSRKDEAVPVIEAELRKEIANSSPNNFFLLDMGSFLTQEAGRKDGLVVDVLSKIDPRSEIIRANFKELFDYTFALAGTADLKILPVIDRDFLPASEHVPVPQHALDLDRTLQCVFLYGVYGNAGEDHLWRLAEEAPERSDRILEILTWIGTARSVPQVVSILKSRRGYDTVVRGVGYLMQLGGPQGREAVLGLDASGLEGRAREYIKKIRPEVERQSYATLAKALEKEGRSKPKLSSEQVKSRLQGMYDTYGKDQDTHPADILDSGLPPDYLIQQLVGIRARMLHRLSDEGLSDVRITDVIINTLQYAAGRQDSKR